MTNPETIIMQDIRLALGGREDVRLFRNNTGAFQDKYTGRLIEYGLAVGSPDLVGWRAVTITSRHVGRTLAVFTGIEVKTPRGRLSIQQDAFLTRIAADGGLSGVARTTEDAYRIINAI